MTSLDLAMNLNRYLFLTIAFVRDLLILPLDFVVLVFTTIMAKILQEVVLLLIYVLMHTEEALKRGDKLFNFLWNAAIKYYVFSFDYFCEAFRSDCIQAQEHSII